ncbi:MAG: pyruvate ferredoxin oxidoreductase [Thermoplasmata archaeon]|nr:MAG: pyruvate ferredoxin oxidoreductase [Thermoplasmata archaeon]
MVRMLLTGNKTTAYSAMRSRVQVVSAYPITPQTTIVEHIAEFIADGLMKAEYIQVESEHSAMAAAIAASNTGARAFTATSAHGLLLMHEMLHWATGARLPVVMVNVNRALGPPWSVWADHLDSISQRDTGWMQYYVENNQEIFDTVIMAYKVSERPDIMLPSMISQDAFYLSHTVEPVDIVEQEVVDNYLPPYDPPYRLDVNNPAGFGSLVMPNHYYEFRYKIAEAMEKAKKYIKEAAEEWYEITGRDYRGLLDCYRCEDADVVLFGAGTMMSTAKEVVDWMRAEGKKVGVARIRVFRPFPGEDVRKVADGAAAIGVMDRAYGFGRGGAFFNEVNSALYNHRNRPPTKNYIIGLGGRDVKPRHIRAIFNDLLKVKDEGLDGEFRWFGLRRENMPEEEI